MDLAFKRKSSQTFLAQRKLKTQLILFKDKYINFKSIIKFILPIAIVLALVPVALVYLVNITYQRRTISTPQEIPLELRTGVVILRQEDILYDFDKAKKLITEIKDLYSSKRVTQILIVSYNNNSTVIPSIEPFQQFFTDIPTDNYKIDISSKNIFDACNIIQSKYQVQKFVLTAYRNVLPRITYACNFKGLYAKPYLQKDFQFSTKENDFNQTLKIIIKSIFSDYNLN